MDKCIIFGASDLGRSQLYKISQFYEVECFCDNDKEKWGKKIGRYEILPLFVIKKKSVFKIVIICSMSYRQIASQLCMQGDYRIFVMLQGMMYEYGIDKILCPYELRRTILLRTTQTQKGTILFVQLVPCIRTHKIAEMMYQCGWRVELLYIIAPDVSVDQNDEECSYHRIYDSVSTVSTLKGIEDFVNANCCDIVHSSNAPDYITSLLLKCNKPIVHDIHDMESVAGHDDPIRMMDEYIAITQSTGLIHVTNEYKVISNKMYGKKKYEIVIENRISNFLKKNENIEKLSLYDGEIHCVYEGGLTFEDSQNDRYLWDIWKRFTDQKIHIHFYTPANEQKCREFAGRSRYLHYEGNVTIRRLINVMGQYDCGLVLFNINISNEQVLKNASANKFYEYLCAGLPVILDPIMLQYKEIVNKFHIGICIDYNKDLATQIHNASCMKIEEDFLDKNGFTMESQATALERFYIEVIKSYQKK